MAKTATVTEGQTLLDVAMQELGSPESIFDLADANGLAITAELTSGQALVIPTSLAARAELVAYYASRQHRINTATTDATSPPDPEPIVGDFHHPDFHTPDFN
jgi:hypothetical protein